MESEISVQKGARKKETFIHDQSTVVKNKERLMVPYTSPTIKFCN